MSQEIIVFTDGACSGNPGPGGWGAIICYNEDRVIELGGGKASTTNNHMELFSILAVLQEIGETKNTISIYTDSTYVIHGATKWIWGWAKKNWVNSENNVVSNKDLWEKLHQNLTRKNFQLKWNYVRGHTGVVGNERCDQIAVAFSKGETPYLYRTDYNHYSYKIFPLPKPEPVPEMKFGNNVKKDEKVYYISLINGVVSRYQTWSECESAVKGRPGVRFKKVKNQEEETQVLKSWGV